MTARLKCLVNRRGYIAREGVETVKKRHDRLHWTVRENVRANLQVIVKRILRQYGYLPGQAGAGDPDRAGAGGAAVAGMGGGISGLWWASPRAAGSRSSQQEVDHRLGR